MHAVFLHARTAHCRTPPNGLGCHAPAVRVQGRSEYGGARWQRMQDKDWTLRHIYSSYSQNSLTAAVAISAEQIICKCLFSSIVPAIVV